MPRRTADDRIRRVTLYGLRSDPRWWLRVGRVPQATHAQISKRAGARIQARANKASTNTPLIFVTGFIAVMFAYFQLSQYSEALAGTVAGLGIGIITLIVIQRTSKDGAVATQLIAAFLDAGRCPACGCELAGREPEEDGCTVCPECGAAWKMPTKA